MFNLASKSKHRERIVFYLLRLDSIRSQLSIHGLRCTFWMLDLHGACNPYILSNALYLIETLSCTQ